MAASLDKVLADPKTVHAISEALTVDKAKELMTSTYLDFINLDSAKKSFSTFYQDLLAHELTPTVFHCTTGKDRTGWTAATFLSLLGVDRSDVYREYLLTNDRLVPSLKPVFDEFAAAGGDPALLQPILGVDKVYLDTAFGRLEEVYGTVERYFDEGLGIDLDAQWRCAHASSSIPCDGFPQPPSGHQIASSGHQLRTDWAAIPAEWAARVVWAPDTVSTMPASNTRVPRARFRRSPTFATWATGPVTVAASWRRARCTGPTTSPHSTTTTEPGCPDWALRTVIDLRTEVERNGTPDPSFPGATELVLDVLADAGGQALPANLGAVLADPKVAQQMSEQLTPESARTIMTGNYRDFIDLESAQRSFRGFFSHLLGDAPVPTLFHCTTGKDRTGWAAATFLSVLGVDRADVYREYLLTNDRLVPAPGRFLTTLPPQAGIRICCNHCWVSRPSIWMPLSRAWTRSSVRSSSTSPKCSTSTRRPARSCAPVTSSTEPDPAPTEPNSSLNEAKSASNEPQSAPSEPAGNPVTVSFVARIRTLADRRQRGPHGFHRRTPFHQQLPDPDGKPAPRSLRRGSRGRH